MERLRGCLLVLCASAALMQCAGSPAPAGPGRTEVAVGDLLVSIVDDFDHATLPLVHHEEYWGECVTSASGEAGVLRGASVDGSACGRYSFEAQLGCEDVIGGWSGSGLEFVCGVISGEPIGGREGVSLALKAEGCAVGTIRLRQQAGGAEMWFAVEVVLDDGTWQEPKIPFAAFAPGEPAWRLDPLVPVTVEVGIPFLENWERFAMRTGSSIRCGLSVDNVGFYKTTAAARPGVVETFDDDLESLPFSAVLYGTSSTMDYSDGGEEVRIRNPGVSGQRMRLTRKQGGEAGSGRYLCLDADLDLTGEIGPFLEAGQSIALFMSAPLGTSLAGYSALSFAVRSELLASGTLELQDIEHESYYYFSFPVTASWTRVRVPFREWKGEQRSVEDTLEAGVWGERPRVLLSFDVPPERLVGAGAGRLHLEIGFDDFLLGK